jgi:DNA polymerase/3'-5' exonuclease PolX
MNLPTAKRYAEQLVNWVMPHAWPAQVAGSIRRDCPVCNDVDIVCIPKIHERRDLFGTVISSTNLLHKFLQEYVAASGGRARFQSGGDLPGKSVILQLPKCQLDLWFATPETFATRLLCRTGSMQHNIWLASRAKRQGDKWTPYEGVLTGGQWRTVGERDEYVSGTLKQFGTEAELYAWFSLPFIEPKQREHDWLVKNFGEA